MSFLRNFSRVARRRFGPWIVWIATMVAVALLFSDINDRGRVLGFAHTTEYKVAAPTMGRIKSIAVEIGQSVKTGAVIAVIDGSKIDAQIRGEAAEIKRLEALIKAKALEVRRKGLSEARILDRALENAQRALNQAHALRRNKAAQLRVVRLQQTRLKRLVAKRLTPQAELEAVEARLASLKSQVGTAGSTASLLKTQLKAAQQRRSLLGLDPVEAALAPLKEQIKVIETRLDFLQLQRQNLVLRAPADGQVYRIIQRPGDVAAAGQTIVRLIGSKSNRVVACVPEYEALSLRIGHRTMLKRRGNVGKPIRGHVVSLGPIVDQVPVRCRRDPRMPAWGRDVVIVLDEPSPLIPGQAFFVSFKREKVKPGTAVAATAPVAEKPGAPKPIKVPVALSSRSRFEPSGLTWVPHLSRYVVVSDDTGWKKHDKNAPWLFTMNRTGQLDPSPLSISGLTSVNDLEGIASHGKDSLYILSSQSFNRKGNRKGHRQLFARLARHGKGYHALSSVRLAKALEVADASFREQLGITNMADLDIEGLANLNGRLLLGLKAPLDKNGHAIIWEMASPDRFLASGAIQDAGLKIWARVKLVVKADGRDVPGGIAELLPLPDGRLLLASTASGINPNNQDGALWVARGPTTGKLSPKLVRTFAGLKPEGLALTPKTGEIAVVFDKGQGTPLWVKIPWPQP